MERTYLLLNEFDIVVADADPTDSWEYDISWKYNSRNVHGRGLCFATYP
jgi:hypothetical protein